MGGQRFWRYMLIWALLVATIWIGDRFVRGVFLTASEPRAVTARGSLAESEESTISLFDATAPSVVYIFTDRAETTGDPGGRGSRGAGSGFIWDAAGHVVTNHHVVEGATRVAVRLDSGEAVPARVIGIAPNSDLAVLRLSENRAALRPIPIGTSDDLKVGQSVYAIGNPFGLTRSLSTGVISALERRLPAGSGREIAGVIQTDAAINPGNSGGPLLDSAGRLIGVNTAILSGSGSFAGIGFAVPADTVNRIVPKLIQDGRVPTPGIGIRVAPEQVGAQLGVTGVVIAEVILGSAADRAGLRGFDPSGRRAGDVITHADGHPVATLAELATQLEQTGVGHPVTLTIWREGRTFTVDVTVIDIS
ncbi:S1C family serine protease [Skermanella pratensis]|uniref:S1C family serine protease n=1 Tax=Skermanella pratensis TaxID=2233999 RepID=UPI001787955E|nr:trypsin-like peptidase domain-containing protein [Skermanella pratensis]